MSSGGEPNQTLYLNNMPTKMRKQDLKMHLYVMFGAYGQILDLVVLKTEKMRGQAHVVFKEIPSAVAAMRAFQGHVFFGKPLRIAFARGPSKAALEFERHVLEPARVEIARQAATTALANANVAAMQMRTETALQMPQAFLGAIPTAATARQEEEEMEIE